MKFGMIGAGTLSQAVAGHVVKAGHDVVFSNSRGPDTLGSVVEAFGPHASAGTVDEAGAADFVVLAVPWKHIRDALRSLPARDGRILVDATNPSVRVPPGAARSEERRVGKECSVTCRSRWSPYH